MAQLARSHAPQGEFDPAFWSARGLGEKPTTREKFLSLTIDELAKTGPHSFNATLICDLLGTTYPMVNHYFGNRNGLVAEAVAVAYRGYSESLRVAAETGDTPEARLESWIWQQIRWTSEHPGISVVLDFPESSLEVTTILREQFQGEITNLFEYNMALLMHLVLDIQAGRTSPIEFEIGALPRAEYMGNLALVQRASSIGLATMGAAVWLAGQHAAGSQVEETQRLGRETLHAHVSTLVSLAAQPF